MKKGFTLIETLIAIAILVIVIVGIVGVLQMNIRIANRTSSRVGAVSLINKRMEMLRNLDYDNIGTIGGIPSGDIPQQETIILNDIEYTLKTFIQYFDDLKDGIGENDENGITADYKKARLEISWPSRNPAAPVIAVSDFMPKGIESIIGGGTLSINIFDAQIQPISLANVHIINNDIIPLIDINVQTNDQGKIVFPGSPSIGEYQITVTKNGYSTAQTYDAILENPSPSPGHLTILEGQTTDTSFTIDLLSSLTIQTLANAVFDMTGEKTIGDLVYKYNETHISDIYGRTYIPELEWDLYDFSNFKIGSNLYDVSASSPPEPMSIEPGTINIIEIFLVSHATNTLLITVRDNNQELVSSASVRLYKVGYDETILTQEFGQSFFTPLQSANYNLEVSKMGYQTYLLEDFEINNNQEINITINIP
ncbi:carboxypeptidase-like regulatory domain-containing protein [Patescibacteria group bacterium]|nr:carboxypeptidase-like regulatory domain-containing protein [Patescibacteria group bacterium]